MTTTNNTTTDRILPTLIPIEVHNGQHRAAFQAQRVICGWKFNDQMVDKMFKQTLTGERFLYWVCLPFEKANESSASNGTTAEIDTGKTYMVVSKDGKQVLGLQQTAESTDSEKGQDTIKLPILSNSSSQSKQGNGDNTTTMGSLFIPVGHFSIDLKDLEDRPAPLLGNGDGSTVAITTLFILPAFRKLGLASSTMHVAQEMLAESQVPFNIPESQLQKTTTIALTTLSERHWILDEPNGNQMWVRYGGRGVGMPYDGRVVQYLGPWYESLGYTRVTEMAKFRDSGLSGGQADGDLWWAEIWTKSI